MYRDYGVGWVGFSGERCWCPASPRASQAPQVDRKRISKTKDSADGRVLLFFGRANGGGLAQEQFQLGYEILFCGER
jgi:hypothetical protein